MSNKKIVVLGAGISGIGAGYQSKLMGLDCILFESKASAGGLIDNFQIDGFRFDNAVHLSFATEQEVRDLFDPTPHYKHAPHAECFDNDIWLKHPIQNNLYPLPVAEKLKLVKSFLERPEINVENYHDWLLHQYGAEITQKFHARYTKKYWAVSAEKLSTTWIGNRLRRANVDEILLGTMTNDTGNGYYANEMRYPKKGGYRAFVEPIMAGLDIRTNMEVIKIDTGEKCVYFNDGSSQGYDFLFSSIPLPELPKIIKDCPLSVHEAASRLFATSVDLVSIGFHDERINKLWFYIYDEDIFASRAYSPSVKSPDNAPVGKSSIQFEIYSSKEMPNTNSPAEMMENCRYALEKMGISKREEIITISHKKLKYGNVVFYSGMENDRAIVLNYLESIAITPIGRFGEWAYLWSNQALLSGINAVRNMAAS